MCVVFFKLFFYEGRFGEDRDIYRSTRVRVADPKAKAGSHRKTDLKYMMLSPKKTITLHPGHGPSQKTSGHDGPIGGIQLKKNSPQTCSSFVTRVPFFFGGGVITLYFLYSIIFKGVREPGFATELALGARVSERISPPPPPDYSTQPPPHF
jgi:hypothetical protein